MHANLLAVEYRPCRSADPVARGGAVGQNQERPREGAVRMRTCKWVTLAALATGVVLSSGLGLGGCGVWGLVAAGVGAVLLLNGGLNLNTAT